MTVVTGSFNAPGQSGNVGFSGSLWWQPTARHTSGTAIVLPQQFIVQVDSNGTMTPITVDPTGATWCWKVTESFAGIAQNVVRYVQVPASGTVAYKDLVDVDPLSLQPNAPAPAVVDGGAASLPNKFIQFRRDTAANWTAANPVLAQGETGLETDTKKRKLGDGITAWSSLGYQASDQATLDAKYGRFFFIDPRDYGTVDLTGTADSSAAILAAIAAAQSTGGTIQLPQGTIRCDSQIVFAVGSGGKQKNVRITGTGRASNWDSGNGNGASILDLRYSGSNTKIGTYAQGILELDHFTLTDLGTSTTPFFQTTGTTLHVHDMAVIGNPSKSRNTCDQDVFILGGLTTTTTNDGPTTAFQGYGTVIERVEFDRIRRGVLMQTYCNSVVVRDNSFSNRCGSAGNEGAIESDPGTASGSPVAFSSGNIITSNLIEVYGYKYGIRMMNKSQQNIIQGNSFWDYQAGYLGDIYFDTNAGTNTVISSGVQTQNLHMVDTNGTNMYFGALFGPVGYQAAIVSGNQGAVLKGGGGLTFDNNAAAILQNDSGGTKRTLMTLSSSNTIYLGDANAAMSNNSVIVRCGATGSIVRIRAGSIDQVQVSSAGLGFFGSSPAARPSLTYSRSIENAAQTQIRTALQALGLIADNTVA